MGFQAFISCTFPADDDVTRVCTILQPEISPYISRTIHPGSLPDAIKEEIRRRDCLIAVLTPTGDSAWVNNEVGIAFALKKPIYAIYEKSVNPGGIQPYLSTYVQYVKGNTEGLEATAKALKDSVIEHLVSIQIEGSRQDLMESCSNNGVYGIYPDRASGFRAFQRMWNGASDISIVGSTVEGFKTGVGISAEDLLRKKLNEDPDSAIRILLTHDSFAPFRERQEDTLPGHITRQLKVCREYLEDVRNDVRSGDRLQWKYFRGAPTCFMIIAGEFMLLNPYLYMQPAYYNFCMIVRDTKSYSDIYNHYKNEHFERAWARTDLTTEDLDMDR